MALSRPFLAFACLYICCRVAFPCTLQQYAGESAQAGTRSRQPRTTGKNRHVIPTLPNATIKAELCSVQSNLMAIIWCKARRTTRVAGNSHTEVHITNLHGS
eukprot:6188717-Pleurochrysis_carterae.AAC.2